LRREVGPLQFGFDQSYGFFHGQIDKYTHRYKNGDRTWHRNDQLVDEEGHSLDLITEEAIKFIKRPRDKPFFLYVPYGAPHPPLQEASEPVAPATGPGDEDYTAFEQRVLRAVGELPADQRDALLLREQGFSLADISAITGAASETVKSRLRYGRTQLRAQLGDSL